MTSFTERHGPNDGSPLDRAIAPYLTNATHLQEVFRTHASSFSPIYYNKLLPPIILPYVICRPGLVQQRLGIFSQLVTAAQNDGKRTILEIGPGRKQSPLQTAADEPNTLVIAIENDPKKTPRELYSQLDISHIPKPQNGSLAVFLPLDAYALPQTSTFSRVQLIAPTPFGIDPNIVPHAGKFVALEGELLVVFDRKWNGESLQSVLTTLLEEGFAINFRRMSALYATGSIGITQSRFIKGLNPRDMVCVLRATRSA